MSTANSALYEDWKKTAKVSDQFQMTLTQKAEDQKYEEAKNKFFATTDIDNQNREEDKMRTIAENSVFNMKKQFLPESNQSEKPKHHFNDNIDFMSTNNFYQGLTKNSIDNQIEPTQLEDIEPEVYQVAAKKESSLWKTSTYKDPEFRAELTQTTDRMSQGYDPEIAKKLHVSKNNKRITVISEYSNAKHNGRVFKNPRFTSC
mmetsp:Transcript_7478/g.8495  ORF Transcript_7478/g.8495 Transcript_7478/m.8495 type:complete len:203 (+) Transcript_7478:36-644(+)|eukprot:CAMPEP_0205828034 /NCGR_PEP_ID=MMETSP0206-20130828/33898_1 /ASSEMBLY_ACC=CAM_ASM_000279 /TAXON_ID=36767 /ORGANISM="Euplotes focardii, Strain TN1" /LENGTH=202 /DNA_ID=CAMNT_0053129467 /DNA_START=31 /DNA_END=639 /DNA_ORIENTATION=+